MILGTLTCLALALISTWLTFGVDGCLSGGGPNNFQSGSSTLSDQTAGEGFNYKDEGVLYDLLGGVGAVPYSGGALPILHPSDLDCDFTLGHRCCWDNTNGRSDELDWLLALTTPNAEKALQLWKTNNHPNPQYLIVASYKTAGIDQALLVSCPIYCQRRPGKLQFNHWIDNSSYLDVCTLPIGVRSYSKCEQVKVSSPGPSIHEIAPHDEPFQIVFVASNFVGTPGSAIALDNIRYTNEGDSCFESTTTITSTSTSTSTTAAGVIGGGGGGVTETTTTASTSVGQTTTTTASTSGTPQQALPGAETSTTTAATTTTETGGTTTTVPINIPKQPICDALTSLDDCPNVTDDGVRLCGWVNLEKALFVLKHDERNLLTNNYAAGVPPPKDGAYYTSASVNETSRIARIQSSSFDVPEGSDLTLAFQVFESADRAQAEICTNFPSKCEYLSRYGVLKEDYVWKDANFTLPAGAKNLTVTLVANSDGYNHVGIGFKSLHLLYPNGTNFCPSSRRKQRS